MTRTALWRFAALIPPPGSDRLARVAPLLGTLLKRRGPAVTGSSVRVAIVGAGKFAARTWYPLLTSMKGVNVAAACARSETRLKPLARRHRIRSTWTNLDEMLDTERPEAVVAVLPPGAVLPVARAVLKRGIPLAVEKPPGQSAVETRELAELASSHAVASLVCFNRRYCAVVTEARDRVERAGGIRSILVEFHKEKPAGGDDLVTDVIHMVDLLRALGGEVEDVAALTGASSGPARGSPAWHALVRFQSGATGVLAAFRSGGARRERIELHGAGLSVDIELPERAMFRIAGSSRIELVEGRRLAGSRDPLETYGFAREARLFLEAVRGGPPPPSDLADAVRTMELVERIRDSARRKTLVMTGTAERAAPDESPSASGPGATAAFPPTGSAPAAAFPPVSAARDQSDAANGPSVAVGETLDRPAVAILLASEVRKLVFPEPVRERLLSFARILEPSGELGRREAARLLLQADGAITSWKSPRLTGEMALVSRKLRIIAHAAGSVKNLVDPVFFDRGVAVTSAASAIAPSVGEMALAMTLAGLRALFKYDREVRRGFRKDFLAAPPDSRGLFGRRVGLVGFGRTAREFARLLEPFGCEILAFDPFARPGTAPSSVRLVPLDEIVTSCDVISLHAAWTPETYHLLDARRIGMMKDGAILVNTSRGGLVDEAALAAELRTGRISAALDVTSMEPLPSGADFIALPNVILTPHISGPTFDRLPELGRTAVEDLRVFFSGGRPANLVTIEMLSTMA